MFKAAVENMVLVGTQLAISCGPFLCCEGKLCKEKAKRCFMVTEEGVSIC